MEILEKYRIDKTKYLKEELKYKEIYWHHIDTGDYLVEMCDCCELYIDWRTLYGKLSIDSYEKVYRCKEHLVVHIYTTGGANFGEIQKKEK